MCGRKTPRPSSDLDLFNKRKIQFLFSSSIIGPIDGPSWVCVVGTLLNRIYSWAVPVGRPINRILQDNLQVQIYSAGFRNLVGCLLFYVSVPGFFLSSNPTPPFQRVSWTHYMQLTGPILDQYKYYLWPSIPDADEHAISSSASKR